MENQQEKMRSSTDWKENQYVRANLAKRTYEPDMEKSLKETNTNPSIQKISC